MSSSPLGCDFVTSLILPNGRTTVYQGLFTRCDCLKSVPHQNGDLFIYLTLGLVSTYLCTYHRTEEFIFAFANYVISQGVRITDRPDIFL